MAAKGPRKEDKCLGVHARLGKQDKHFTLRYDQSIYVVSLN